MRQLRDVWRQLVGPWGYFVEVPGETTPALFLHRQYRLMYEELHARVLDQDMSSEAPAFVAEAQYRQPDGSPQTAQETLNAVGHIFAGDVGVRVKHHVNALAVAYCPTDPDPSGPGRPLDPRLLWPNSAAFTLARSILEGAALYCWLLDPRIEPDERLRRAAVVELWSAENNDQDPSEPRWLPDAIRIVESAGYVVYQKDGRNLGLRREGKPPARFSHSMAVREVFGSDGVTNYRRWSGRTHHAVWASKGSMSFRFLEQGEASGYSLQSSLEEPAHVAVAANVATILARLIDDKAAFYGQERDGSRLREQARFLQISARDAEADISRKRVDPNPSTS